MADKSKIEWTDATWNPIRARNRETGGVGHFCVHVSDGCSNCYAEHMQRRFRNPVRYAAQDRGKIELFLDEDVLMQPLRWRRHRMIFPCSMTDLFFEDHPDEWIDKVFAVMALAPQHIFQVLTKRAERMREYKTPGPNKWFHDRIRSQMDFIAARGWPSWKSLKEYRWPLPNVWMGVSVEDQARADERIPLLLKTPAAVRWISAEPLLGPISLFRWLPISSCAPSKIGIGIDWVVAGGESGQAKPGRPMHPDWPRALRDQCQAAGVPFHFKQWGDWAWSPDDMNFMQGVQWAKEMGALEIEQHSSGHTAARVGKTRAGRLLDRRSWDEMPGWDM